MSSLSGRYAVIRGQNFALQALRRGDPALAGRAVAVVQGEGRKSRLLEVSAEAAAVTADLAVELAVARCPGLLLRARRPDLEVEAQRLLLAAAFALSPRVETTAPGCCTIDLQGADPERLAGVLRRTAAELAALGMPVRIGVGATPWLAALASSAGADEVCLVTDVAGFLAPLPLAWAEPSPAQAELLRRWGLRTFGELTALPKAEISRRWGEAGAALWERAAGETVRVLRLAAPARTFAAEWTYEPPVESIEPLFFRLRRFAERVALELAAAGWVAERLALTLLLEDESEYRREFRLPEPTGEVDVWLRVISAHLDSVRTAAPVGGVRLVASPARPAVKQDGLFDTGLVDPPAFWENLARLGAIVGADRVGTPAAAASLRPDAFALGKPVESIPPPEPPPVHARRGLLLRRFRPPPRLCVALREGRPAEVQAGGTSGEVAAARGPWRTSGDWWKAGAWAVEIWEVELKTGGVYQIAHDAEGWRLDGMLD